MSSVLDELREMHGRIRDRIAELEPYADELAELRAQADRLGIDLTTAPKSSNATRQPSARKPRPAATSKPRRRRRSTGGPSRADQVLALVRQHPGTTIPAVARELGVDSTGLYRVVRSLEEDGQLRKVGRELQPIGSESRGADAEVAGA